MRDQLIEELDDKGETLDSVVQAQKEQQQVEEMTLSKMIELWDGARRTAGKASERTLLDGRRWLGHVEKHLGNVPLKDINAQMVERTYAAIREERNLSGTSMNHIHTLLKNVFQKAIDYDFIYKNPCAHVDTPRRNDPKRQSLSADEGARLMREVNEAEEEAYAAMDEKEERRRYREDHGIARDRAALRGLHHIGCVMAVRIGLATGMRRGEVFALTWENVDLDQQTIRVCQSITYKCVVKSPKTQAGIRTVAIDDTTAAHLAAWKQSQAEELAKISVKQVGPCAARMWARGTASTTSTTGGVSGARRMASRA
ncbi:tyrosine-type recombinase/integrase [Olsenella phocaeensis]|uniref:tyrosine-type recombinase/integrase n=1 Tax=Olsenella phocaeensis TaxID=1852385 RepID=UPI003A93FB70